MNGQERCCAVTEKNGCYYDCKLEKGHDGTHKMWILPWLCVEWE